MNINRITIIIFGILVIIGAILAIVLTKKNDDLEEIDEEIWDIKYLGNSKKYQSSINAGLAMWSSIIKEKISIIFKTKNMQLHSEVANTRGSIVTIIESQFNKHSSYLKGLIVAHEIGHVLGIGLWGRNNVINKSEYSYLSDSKFPATAKAYKEHVSIGAGGFPPGPPILTGGGEGTADVHWAPNFGMSLDLMVGYISSSTNRISIVDLMYLDEIGKKVDISKAQPLTGSYYSVIVDYINGDEKICCGTCCGYHKEE